jgi:S1-C subfamily serine protease
MATMEDLTKNQIILLTLLVSFVTSIATGVITTSLLSEAPQSVTQTINRVVERTIEKVAAPAASSTKPTTVKEVTIVKEEDAIIGAVDKSAQAIVRIKSPVAQDGSQAFYALGVIVSKDGLVLSDKRGLIAGGTYSVTLADGTSLSASLLETDDTDHLALFKISPDQAHTNNFRFVPVAANDLKLGQTVIAIEGREKNSIGIGRVLALNTRTEKDTKGSDVRVLYSVTTDINPLGEIQGSPLLDLRGELVGIKSSTDDLIVPQNLYTTLVPIHRLLQK